LSGIRVWDYSDPENPALASTFDTVCSASPTPIPECDPLGTYSVHNVIVETTGKTVKAYLSWYWDRMLVLDVTDPYDPKEIARYFDNSPEFLESNGGQPHDFWGSARSRTSRGSTGPTATAVCTRSRNRARGRGSDKRCCVSPCRRAARSLTRRNLRSSARRSATDWYSLGETGCCVIGSERILNDCLDRPRQ